MSDHTDLGDRFFVHGCHFGTFHTVACDHLVIYLLNATIILLQNTKLSVKFTRDGRPYPHLTPHCRWPGRLPVATVHGWLMADRHHGEPNTLWPSDYRSPNCTCIILTCSHMFQSTRFALFNRCRMWQMAAVNQTFLRLQMNAGKPCCTKECEVTPNWTKHTKRACYLDNEIFLCWCCCRICCCCCMIHTKN